MFEGSEIKTLFHFEDDHKDVEGIFKVSEKLQLDQGWDSFETLSGPIPAAFARSHPTGFAFARNIAGEA